MKKLVALILTLVMVLGMSAAFASNISLNGVYTGVVEDSSPAVYEGEECFEISVLLLGTGQVKKYYDTEDIHFGTKLRVEMEEGKVINVEYPTPPLAIVAICIFSALGFLLFIKALLVITNHPTELKEIFRKKEYFVAVEKDGTISGAAFDTLRAAKRYGKRTFCKQFDHVEKVRYPLETITIFGDEKLLKEEMRI